DDDAGDHVHDDEHYEAAHHDHDDVHDHHRAAVDVDDDDAGDHDHDDVHDHHRAAVDVDDDDAGDHDHDDDHAAGVRARGSGDAADAPDVGPGDVVWGADRGQREPRRDRLELEQRLVQLGGRQRRQRLSAGGAGAVRQRRQPDHLVRQEHRGEGGRHQ